MSVDRLRTLIAGPPPLTGTVQAVTGGQVHVATARGLVVAAPGSTDLAPGERVTVRDGTATRAGGNGPTHTV